MGSALFFFGFDLFFFRVWGSVDLFLDSPLSGAFNLHLKICSMLCTLLKLKIVNFEN